MAFSLQNSLMPSTPKECKHGGSRTIASNYQYIITCFSLYPDDLMSTNLSSLCLPLQPHRYPWIYSHTSHALPWGLQAIFLYL